MKKIISIISIFILSFSLCACDFNNPLNSDKDKFVIVTTIFPIYDWVSSIVGDNENYEIKLLLDKGTDLHSYQPTAEDIINISNCNMFIYVGGESDKWVEEALSANSKYNIISLNLLNILGDKVYEEEIIEGMEAEDEEEEGVNPTSDEEPEYDEHVWLSLKNAQIICKEIAEKIELCNPANSLGISDNTTAYCNKLELLDKEYEKAVKEGSKDTLLFADRFPFRYLTDDYKLNYYAAFAGCSAETEASFETVLFLADKVNELNLSFILQIESSDGKLSNTVKEATQDKNQSILTMNSMQSTTLNDMNNGVSYLSIMEDNLNVLKEALK